MNFNLYSTWLCVFTYYDLNLCYLWKLLNMQVKNKGRVTIIWRRVVWWVKIDISILNLFNNLLLIHKIFEGWFCIILVFLFQIFKQIA